MNHNLHVNKTNFHVKGFALGLTLKQRRKATWTLSILYGQCQRGNYALRGRGGGTIYWGEGGLSMRFYRILLVPTYSFAVKAPNKALQLKSAGI